MSVFSRVSIVALLLLVCASPSSAFTAFWLFLPWGIVTLHEYFQQLPPESQQQTQSAIDQEVPRTFYVPDYGFPVLDVGNVLLPSFSRIPGEVLGAEIMTILLTSMTLLMLFRLIRSPLFFSGKRSDALSNSSNLIGDGLAESHGVVITQNAGNLTISDLASAVIEADSDNFNGELISAEKLTPDHDNASLEIYYKEGLVIQHDLGKSNLSRVRSNLIEPASKKSNAMLMSNQLISSKGGSVVPHNSSSCSIESNSWERNGALVSQNGVDIRESEAWNNNGMKINNNAKDFYKVDWNLIASQSKMNGMRISKQLIPQEEGGSAIPHNASSCSIESNSWEHNGALVSQNSVDIRESEAWKNNGMLINNNIKDFYKVDWNLIASESRNNNALISQEDVGKTSIPSANWTGSHSLKNSGMLISNGSDGFYFEDWRLLASDSRENSIALIRNDDDCIYYCSAVDNNILWCMFMGCVLKQRLSFDS
jgi:hypothetical protein